MLKIVRYCIVSVLFFEILLASEKTLNTYLTESVLKNYIKLPANGPKRIDLLNRFLAAKTFENSEKIVNHVLFYFFSCSFKQHSHYNLIEYDDDT